jgi:hypothetical protein
MSQSFFERAVSWLVPDDERGVALIGDWCEVYAQWRAEGGALRAVGLLSLDVVRSLPGLTSVALRERGWRRTLLRSVPAVALGYAAFAVFASLAGGTTQAPEFWTLTLATLLVGALAMLSGWIAAVVAGEAPRQHGVLVGLGLSMSGALLAQRGTLELGFVAGPFLVLILVAASAGGACHRVKRRTGGHATP